MTSALGNFPWFVGRRARLPLVAFLETTDGRACDGRLTPVRGFRQKR